LIVGLVETGAMAVMTRQSLVLGQGGNEQEERKEGTNREASLQYYLECFDIEGSKLELHLYPALNSADV
jgi:hypothetical protein